MKIAIIGRTEILYNTAIRLRKAGYDIRCILTSKEAPEYKRSSSDFQKLAKKWKIPFAQGARILKHRKMLKTSRSEIGVSINYTGIVPQEIVDIFPHGILNAHSGDLPRYRGNACQAWAILNGEKRIGLCVHKMIGGKLDSGDIITRDYLPIDHTTKVTAVWQWMESRTPDLMLEALQKLGANPRYVLEKQSKDPVHALRCYPRKPVDGRIDWSKPAIDVLRLINASNKPYAGAFCKFEGQKLIIWDAEVLKDDELFCAVPGQVTKIGKEFVEVACGKEKLRILSVEYNNRVSGLTNLIKSTRQRLE